MQNTATRPPPHAPAMRDASLTGAVVWLPLYPSGNASITATSGLCNGQDMRLSTSPDVNPARCLFPVVAVSDHMVESARPAASSVSGGPRVIPSAADRAQLAKEIQRLKDAAEGVRWQD